MVAVQRRFKLTYVVTATITVFSSFIPSISLAQGCVDGCPASAGNPIAAAYASEAYYVLADLVFQIGSTDFGLWAPLVYILAAFGGLIMLSLGQPPRNYMWFFLGPAIYSWLLFSDDTSARGVEWQVAGVPQRQEVVWRIADTGIENTNYAIKHGIVNSITTGPFIDGIPLPMPFLWFDSLVSSQVQFFISWTGLHNRASGAGGATTRHQAPAGITADNFNWHILSNSKWPMLENITAGSLHNPDMRDALITFLASECGDLLTRYIDHNSYAAAAQSNGSGINTANVLPTNAGILAEMEKEFSAVKLPVPPAMKRLVLPGRDVLSYGDFLEDAAFVDPNWDLISCREYFYAIMQMFRFETGHVYNQLVADIDGYGISQSEIVYDFLYGWDIIPGNNLDATEQQNFIRDLILAHVVRNELALAPTIPDMRYSASTKAINYSEAYQRNIGSKNKYGELYTWAKMMPYIQGVLLYVVTIAYPFCCILFIIPGWHKIMFTWMSFFAWAKSWDAGFAIVMALERSIWATVGNTDEQSTVNERIFQMQDDAELRVECVDLPADQLGCSDPDIFHIGKMNDWDELVSLWDSVLVLSSHLDMDLKNSFYIYTMSALYFAVPAVTGQVILGAKSGASGMISNMVGGVSSSAGNAVGQAIGGEVNVRGSAIGAAVGQTSMAKSMRSGSGAKFLAQSYGSQLAQNQGDMDSAAAGHQEKAYGMQMGRNADQASVGKGDVGVRQAVIGGGANSTLDMWKNAKGLLGGGGRSKVGGGKKGSSSAPGTGSGGGTGNAALNPIGHGMLVGASYLANVGGASRNRDIDSKLGQQNAASRGKQLSQAAMGFSSSMMARGHGAMAGRYRDAAQQVAAGEQWTAMRNWSNSVQGKASALGVFSGAFGPGQKPTQIDGMAGIGMLGGSAERGFNNLNPNGSWGARVRTARSGLHDGGWSGIQYNRPTQGFGLIGRGATAIGPELGREASSFGSDGVRDAVEGAVGKLDKWGGDYFGPQK